MGDEAKLSYLFNLLGKKRNSVIQEVPKHKSLTFDTLLNMSDQNLILRDSLETKTSIEQDKVEDVVKLIYDGHLDEGEPLPNLYRSAHILFLQDVLSNPLPSFFKVLDASHPWMIYWCANALKLLKVEITSEIKSAISLNILSYIDKENGGIGGGIGQAGHAAATYAALCSLSLSEDKEAWKLIDRDLFYNWLMSLKQEDGSFVMTIGGEVDTRAVYCALCIASLLDIMTPELVQGVPEWLGKCQTYEGGFGGTPLDEAHGGYTFCAVASLCILGKPSDVLNKYCDLDNLVRWVCMRQLQLEGGFSGRTNKLVDGCYSHWVGGIMPFLEIAINSVQTICSRVGLTNYILMCCQSPDFPGLIDKPGKSTDFYHTNYVLCGLSAAQHQYHIDESLIEETKIDSYAYSYKAEYIKGTEYLELKEEDKVEGLNPIFGLPSGYAERMKNFYSSK